MKTKRFVELVTKKSYRFVTYFERNEDDGKQFAVRAKPRHPAGDSSFTLR